MGTRSDAGNQENTRVGMTALDIGAQSGFYTLLLSKLVGSKGKVIAFEPLPANYRLLDENVGLNGVENVIVEHQAVADHTGEMIFSSPPTKRPSLRARFWKVTTRAPFRSIGLA